MAKKYGPAELFFNREEFSWLTRWVAIKATLPSDMKNRFFFFTTGKLATKNLNQQMQGCWKAMGLPGHPVFNTLRTSVATLVSKR